MGFQYAFPKSTIHTHTLTSTTHTHTHNHTHTLTSITHTHIHTTTLTYGNQLHTHIHTTTLTSTTHTHTHTHTKLHYSTLPCAQQREAFFKHSHTKKLPRLIESLSQERKDPFKALPDGVKKWPFFKAHSLVCGGATKPDCVALVAIVLR